MSHKIIQKPWLFTTVFLAIELVLYVLILTTGGDLLVTSSYVSIVLCFIFGLCHLKKSTVLMVIGLACTVAADFFLVVCSPIEQLWGMVFFLMAQSLYAAKLQRSSRNKTLLLVRAVLIVLAEATTLMVLKEKTDALAVVSICYYANLIVNIIEAFWVCHNNKLLPIGLVLFLLCDTVIGLQAACGVYLPISESSLIYKIIFMDFHLSWIFYLPSQVCIALSTSYHNQ